MLTCACGARTIPSRVAVQAGCNWCTAHGTVSADGHMAMQYDDGQTDTGTASKAHRAPPLLF